LLSPNQVVGVAHPRRLAEQRVGLRPARRSALRFGCRATDHPRWCRLWPTYNRINGAIGKRQPLTSEIGRVDAGLPTFGHDASDGIYDRTRGMLAGYLRCGCSPREAMRTVRTHTRNVLGCLWRAVGPGIPTQDPSQLGRGSFAAPALVPLRRGYDVGHHALPLQPKHLRGRLFRFCSA
jgi:hypothetical protein